MSEQHAGEPSPLWRVCDPAEAVWIDLRRVYQHVQGKPPADPPPPAVRARGFTPETLELAMGEVDAWVRARNGSWLALTTYTISAVGVGKVQVRHFVPRDVLRQRHPQETDPPF